MVLDSQKSVLRKDRRLLVLTEMWANEGCAEIEKQHDCIYLVAVIEKH